MMLSGVLSQLFDYNSSSRHVDSDRKGLSCENNLHQPLDEALFYCFLEHWNHACVVTGNTTGNVIDKMMIFKGVFVVSGQVLAVPFNNLSYLDLFFK
jgi:hypothetical protein